MTEADSENLMDTLAKMLDEHNITHVSIDLQTDDGRGFLIECAPAVEQPLQRVMH